MDGMGFLFKRLLRIVETGDGPPWPMQKWNPASSAWENLGIALPVATASVLGGVKQGSNVTIDGAGVLSVAAPYSLPVATASVLGGVKQGSGVAIAGDGTLSVTDTDTSGTVTSVAMTVPGDLSVSGSPITTSGTLALTRNNQSANVVLAGPSVGSAATPGYRALVAADIPSLDASAIGSGTLSLSRLSGITHSQLDASAGITSGQIASIPNQDASIITTGTLSLSRLSGITTSQLDAAAGIVSGQIAGLDGSKVTGSHTLADSVLSTNVALLNASNTFTKSDGSSTGTFVSQSITPTLTQSGTAGYTALKINATETSTGSGAKLLLDLQAGGNSKFAVKNDGTVSFYGNSMNVDSSGNVNNANTVTAATLKTSSFKIGSNIVYQQQSDYSGANGPYYFNPAANATASTGIQPYFNLKAGINQSSTAGYTALLVNAIETGTGSGAKKILDLQVGSTSRASIDNTGGFAFSPSTTTTAPAAGAAGAIPGAPAGWMTVTVNGTGQQIPYW